MKRILALAASAFAIGALLAALTARAPHQPAQTGPMGWAGQAVAARAREAAKIPELKIAGAEAQDTANRLVCLWHPARRMEIKDPAGNVAKPRGQHLPNIAQEIGDCVSWGNRNACNYSLASGLAWGGSEGDFAQAHAPFIYGISRVQIGGGRLSGDGSTGAWAAKGLEQYGVLPEFSGPPYSGALARNWGRRPGPPEEFRDIAKQFRAEARLVRDWDAATQALSNGWAIAVCSSLGFQKIVEANGRIEGRQVGSWAHCMCFIGYDSRPGREAVYCLNSWGPNAHARASRYAELDNAPPGGFWILRADAERMLRQGDSYAISFNGFKPRPASQALGDLPNGQGQSRNTANRTEAARPGGLRSLHPAAIRPSRLGNAPASDSSRLEQSRLGRSGNRDAAEYQLAA